MTANPLESTQDSPPFEIAGLTDQHLPEAAELFAAGYRALRQRVPSMPPRHEDVEAELARLRDAARREPGVAAIRNGRIVGFLLGRVIPAFKGKRTIYSPEWAHAAESKGRREIYRAMYARSSSRWVDEGYLTHVITVLAEQEEVLDAFFWLEFGLMAGDAMRDMRPACRRPPNVEIRRAGPDDTRTVTELVNALEQYVAGAPIFLYHAELTDRGTIEQRLADPARPSWLGYCGREPVGYVHIQSANPTAAYVIRDERTASIKAAFVKPSYRGRGVGAALLDRAIEWARSAGYERCAVDFEPQNILGSRFWCKHFSPVCYSMIRHIDERIAGGHQA